MAVSEKRGGVSIRMAGIDAFLEDMSTAGLRPDRVPVVWN
jgi:hypothetical protein